MRRSALYSHSSRAKQRADHAEFGQPDSAQSKGVGQGGMADSSMPLQTVPRFASLKGRLLTHNNQLLWAAVVALALLLAASLSFNLNPARKLTQNDINAAVLKTLETTVLPSPAVHAYNTIIPSVVRIVALGKPAANKNKDEDEDGDEQAERSVGTGVVITDKGVILTNLHVVQGSTSIKVTFSDGLETTAIITGAQPENDLAVLQARTIPDDMIAATMRSTADLATGDQVMAVGYPFGIGPSASSGIVSGLKRTFRSPEGGQPMTNLIQFDAAANPGNSGGPLVTMDGAVVGIVTAIYNPNQQRSFVGIGFAVPIENAAAAVGMHPF